jgi:hypothetical protein
MAWCASDSRSPEWVQVASDVRSTAELVYGVYDFAVFGIHGFPPSRLPVQILIHGLRHWLLERTADDALVFRAMPKPTVTSPLVATAAAIDEELREYDELAREAKRVEFNGEKALARATRILQEATTRQPRIQEKLRALVGEIQAAQARQQESLDVLVDVSRGLATRAAEFEVLMARFAALGESAKSVNQLTGQLSTRRNDGASPGELLDGLRTLEEQISTVLVDAEGLARDAKENGWPEIAVQAEAVRQQVGSVKNKLALAQRTMSERAPS